MKRKLLLAALVVASAFAFNANAREDVTSTYLQDADLSSLVGWGDPGRTDWRTNGATNVVEFWNWTNQFNFSQTATLPAGYYRLAVNAFYRNSWGGDGTNNNMAWIFAGEKTQNVVALTSMSELSGYAGSNDLYRAATAFSQGKYSNEFDFDVTGEGTTEVEIGFRGTCPNGGWCILGPVTLYKYTADDYKDDYRAKVTAAEALYDTPMWTADLAALQAAVVDENTLTTVDEVKSAITNLSNAINAANSSIVSYAAAIAPFNKVKAQADAIAAVEYTETTAGSHDTFIAAIATQQTAATIATDAAAITAAITALKDAIKAYINAAEPKNENEYFDITCLMANPNFDDSHNGWTYLSAPGVSWSNCEYYQKEFDIYQTVTGLPTGSYSLSVQAFQRPGWAENVYNDYVNGTDNASSVLYINSITSNVKNIAADAQNTYKLGDGSDFKVPNDSRVGPEGSYKYLPNSQQGAKLYFEAGLYDATCAAVVTSEDGGSLKLGFKSTKTHVDGDWTIFDNFRLYYYGSSLLVYYQKYLPQLKNEASAVLANGAYANVTGKEKADFEAAIAATPASETGEAYKTVIDDITAKQTTFREAVTSYDALVAAKAYAALTKITANIGTGVFQYPASTPDKWTTYSEAKAAVDGYTVTESSTADAIQALVGALDNAIADYNSITLNAPVDGKKYYIKVATDGHAKVGNAIVIVPGSVTANNPTGYGLNANFAPNSNLAQAVTFTKVSGNDYNISFLTAEGTAYLTYGTTNGSGADWKDSQIQATTDASKKGEFTIVATATDNVFNIVNKLTSTNIDCQAGGNIYTDEAITLDGFSVAEASQATVPVVVATDKYATRIFPFAPNPKDLDGITFYSCDEVVGNELTLKKEATPEANKPYILLATKDVDTSVSGWGLAGATSYTAGKLTGVYTAATIPASTDATVNYVLQTQDEKQAFYKVAENFTATAYRAYLTVTTNEAKARAFYFGGDASGIDAISVLTTDEVEAIYTAGGVQVKSLQKGMNIVVLKNGQTQKVFVK